MGKDIELAILFADVVGSTRIYEVMGDLRARDMVLTCVEIMRAATEQNHGTVIKTIGDEIMATFPTANDALNAAQPHAARHPHPLGAEGRGPADRDPHRRAFRPGRAREPRHLRRRRAHREPHDQPGQGRPDHDHQRDGRAARARVAVGRAPDRRRHAQGQDQRGRAVRGAVAEGRRHQHAAGDRARQRRVAREAARAPAARALSGRGDRASTTAAPTSRSAAPRRTTSSSRAT